MEVRPKVDRKEDLETFLKLIMWFHCRKNRSENIFFYKLHSINTDAHNTHRDSTYEEMHAARKTCALLAPSKN